MSPKYSNTIKMALTLENVFTNGEEGELFY